MPESQFIPPGSYQGALKQAYTTGLLTGSYFQRPVGRRWFVDGSNTTERGSDSNSGRTWEDPFLTMARVFEVCDTYDRIYLMGVIKEQLVSPVGVYDVVIEGVASLRQATDSGVATGGGSSWLAPASPTAATALLELIQAGWVITGVQFAPVASSPCIQITRAAASGSTPEKDGSHAIIVGNKFVGGGSSGQGVKLKNGGYNVTIDQNEFESLTGTAIVSDGTGVSVPLEIKIRRNRFNNNTNSIAISSNEGTIQENIIRQAADDANNKVNLISVSAQGEKNMVIGNVFSDAAANVTIAKGYKPGTSDVWRNYVTDAADAVVTVPA